MKARHNDRGTLWFYFVLPSESLRDLVFKRLCQQWPQLNYCCEWKDTHGYGIQMTVTDWAGDSMYHVPPSKRYYK